MSFIFRILKPTSEINIVSYYQSIQPLVEGFIKYACAQLIALIIEMNIYIYVLQYSRKIEGLT